MNTLIQTAKRNALANKMVANNNFQGTITATYSLYQQVSHLEGVIVNCGIASEESFTRFSCLRNMHSPRKLVAFEKHTRKLFFNQMPLPHGSLHYTTHPESLNMGYMQLALQQQSIRLENEFVSGYAADAIPTYLMENPEMKIAFMTLQLDDYEGALTALEFFFPRLVIGGILILENYEKRDEDFQAICDYFEHENIRINITSGENGVYYIVKD